MALIDFFIFQIYRWIAVPVAITLLKSCKNILPQKIQTMLSDRANPNFQLLPARPIWIHASSGEIEYAKPVVRELKAQFPQTPILVTYFSPSAKRLIQKFPGIDLSMALPWDQKKDVEKFLKFYNPRCLLIARTDVWTEVAIQCQTLKIPSFLFSATIAKESSRKGFLAGSLTRTALNALTKIFCVSREDQQIFQDLGVSATIEVAGDTRFDQVLYRIQNPNPVRMELKPSAQEKIWVMGSTWPEDEKALLPAIQRWIEKGHRCILAPHEIDAAHLNQIKSLLDSKKITYDLYSSAPAWKSAVLLVDQVGCLQELYLWGTVAFVGGSFKEKVHSVMEPLATGIPVMVGPHHHNNREALQFQHCILGTNFFAVNQVLHSEEALNVLEKSLEISKPHPKISERVLQSSGCTNKLIEVLKQIGV